MIDTIYNIIRRWFNRARKRLPALDKLNHSLDHSLLWQHATDDGKVNVTSDSRSDQSGPPWPSDFLRASSWSRPDRWEGEEEESIEKFTTRYDVSCGAKGSALTPQYEAFPDNYLLSWHTQLNLKVSIPWCGVIKI